MNKACQKFYIDFVEENCQDQKKLFQATNALLKQSAVLLFPSHRDNYTLSKDMGKYFIMK